MKTPTASPSLEPGAFSFAKIFKIFLEKRLTKFLLYVIICLKNNIDTDTDRTIIAREGQRRNFYEQRIIR